MGESRKKLWEKPITRGKRKSLDPGVRGEEKASNFLGMATAGKGN